MSSPNIIFPSDEVLGTGPHNVRKVCPNKLRISHIPNDYMGWRTWIRRLERAVRLCIQSHVTCQQDDLRW